MNENHSYGCYDDQVAMSLHDLSKAQIVYPEHTTLEQKAEKFIRDYDYFEPYSPDNMCKIITEFVQEETKLLSEHIRELQNDKGKLIDENKEAREIIKDLVKQLKSKTYFPKTDRAEQFLGGENDNV